MNTKTWLLTGATVAILAAATGAPAQAAPAKHHRHHAAPPAENPLASENRMLRDQVQALASRLDAVEAAQHQTEAQVAQAQVVAQQTQKAQATVDDQIKTIPSQVSQAVAAIPKPKKSWTENTALTGRMYYDISNIDQTSNGTKTAPSGTGFDIKRFYLGVDHKFNDTFSANLTTDMQYASAISATEVFLKNAYLQARYSDALTVRVGAAPLPWIPFAEDVYGYRFVEQTVSDRTKFGASADWGVHALGSFNKGMFSYAVSVIDGAGFKAPLRSKGVDIEGRVSAKIDNVTLAVGGYSGQLGKEVQGGAPTFHTASRFNAIAAYTTKDYRLGVEYFSTSNWTSVATVAKDSSDGYSLFGSYNINDKISAFGRYDSVNPNKDTASRKKDEYFNIGLNYEPVKIVYLALVYKRDQVDHGTLSTGSGVIGGSNKGTYDELGLFGQFRW